MFLATLCISDRQVATMQEKKGPDGTLSNEKRGGYFGQRASDAVKETADVLARINQFPRIESHYVRKDSSKRYLSPDLTVPKMYDMYKKMKTR